MSRDIATVPLAPRRRGSVALRVALGAVLLCFTLAIAYGAVAVDRLGALIWVPILGPLAVLLLRAGGRATVRVTPTEVVVTSRGELLLPWRIPVADIERVTVDEPGDPSLVVLGDPAEEANVAVVFREPRRLPIRIPFSRRENARRLHGPEEGTGFRVAVADPEALRTALTTAGGHFISLR